MGNGARVFRDPTWAHNAFFGGLGQGNQLGQGRFLPHRTPPIALAFPPPSRPFSQPPPLPFASLPPSLPSAPCSSTPHASLADSESESSEVDMTIAKWLREAAQCQTRTDLASSNILLPMCVPDIAESNSLSCIFVQANVCRRSGA